MERSKKQSLSNILPKSGVTAKPIIKKIFIKQILQQQYRQRSNVTTELTLINAKQIYTKLTKDKLYINYKNNNIHINMSENKVI